MFKIQKNVARRTATVAYPFDDMEANDCFDIETPEDVTTVEELEEWQKKARAKVSAAWRRAGYVETVDGKESSRGFFSIETFPGCIRVFRNDKPKPGSEVEEKPAPAKKKATRRRTTKK